jgi:hypothetical protein
MSSANELDDLIAENVRDFELGELRRQKLTAAEREKMLTATLGPRIQVNSGEAFTVGGAGAGITARSVWFEFRRIHFATIVGIGVGEFHDQNGAKYCVDINCTVRRSFRIGVSTILESDNFLVALARFTSFRIVPTVEEELREQRRAEELLAASEANVERRQRRMEHLATRQQQLLNELIQVECAPRVSFGMIF